MVILSLFGVFYCLQNWINSLKKFISVVALVLFGCFLLLSSRICLCFPSLGARVLNGPSSIGNIDLRFLFSPMFFSSLSALYPLTVAFAKYCTQGMLTLTQDLVMIPTLGQHTEGKH